MVAKEVGMAQEAATRNAGWASAGDQQWRRCH